MLISGKQNDDTDCVLTNDDAVCRFPPAAALLPAALPSSPVPAEPAAAVPAATERSSSESELRVTSTRFTACCSEQHQDKCELGDLDLLLPSSSFLFTLSSPPNTWRGVVGSAFRLKQSYSTPGPVSTAMADKPSRCEACQLGRLSLLPSVGR